MSRASAFAALLAIAIAPVVPLIAENHLNAAPVTRTAVVPLAHAVPTFPAPVASPAPARASRSTHRPPTVAANTPSRAPSTPTPRGAATGRAPRSPFPSRVSLGPHELVAAATAATGRAVPTAAGRSLGIRDVTQYCWTGDRNAAGYWPQLGDVAVLDRSIPFGTRILIDGLGTFVVRDWIGHGSEFDIYSGRDPSCENRALTFGRQHREVTVQP